MKFNELTTLKNTYLNKNFEGYLITIENNQWVAKRPIVEGIMDELVPLEINQLINKFKDIKGDFETMQDLYCELGDHVPIGEIENYDKREFIENCMLRVLIYKYCKHNNLELHD